MPMRQVTLVLAACTAILAGVGVVVCKQAPGPVSEAQPTAEQREHARLEQEQLAERMRTNESAAVGLLQALVSAQRVARDLAVIDADGDGVGEYGYFAQLAGKVALHGPWGAGTVMDPPVLRPALGDVSPRGTIERSGYLFAMHLPGPIVDERAFAVPEARGGNFVTGAAVPAPDNAEVLWCLYAWPVRPAVTGRRVFFVNQEGDVLETSGGYGGAKHAPRFDAAFSETSPNDMAAPLPTPGEVGNDGLTWSSVDA